MNALLLTCALFLAADDEPKPVVAMVLSVKGDVKLEHAGQKAEPLRAMDLLVNGDRLTAAAEGAARVVFLSDGHSEALKPKTTAAVGDKGCTPADAVDVQARKLSDEQVKNLKDHALSSRAGVGVPRGPVARSATPLVNPPSGSTVLTLKPTLSWEPIPKAKSYEVELRDGSGNKVLWREKTDKPRLEYPPKRDPLEYSVSYQWRITAKMGEDEETYDASVLLVATKDEAKELAELKKLVDSKDATDWLLAAVTYEAHGVYTEALPLYQKLSADFPKEANYHKALANYYDRAGRKDEADKEREAAKKLGAVFPEK